MAESNALAYDDLVRRLAAAIRGATLYSPSHPLVQRGVDALVGLCASLSQKTDSIVIGFIGVLIIAGPEAGLSRTALYGAIFALIGAGLTAVAMIFLRRMSAHEHSITIAFYFMLTSAVIALITALFGWNMPTWEQALVLIFTGLSGGIGQLFLSFSYRFSEASALAPFDYAAMIWAVVLGYFLFGELPAPEVWLGGAIVIAAGLLILWRERRLGRDRALSSPAL